MATGKKNLVEYLEGMEQDLESDLDKMDDEISKTLDDIEWDDWNAVGKMEYTEFPPVVAAAKLELNKKYSIVAIRRVRSDSVSFKWVKKKS